MRVRALSVRFWFPGGRGGGGRAGGVNRASFVTVAPGSLEGGRGPRRSRRRAGSAQIEGWRVG